MKHYLLTLIAAVSATGLVMATEAKNQKHDEHVADLDGQYDPNTIPTDDGLPTPETPNKVAHGENEMHGVYAKHHKAKQLKEKANAMKKKAKAMKENAEHMAEKADDAKDKAKDMKEKAEDMKDKAEDMKDKAEDMKEEAKK